MNIYISADIEGITGTISWNQCGRADGQHYDFPFSRRMMTHDVNAAVKGARAAGADRIVIKDSHGNSKSLLVDELEPGVELISGLGSGVQGMMEGIDSSFDAALLIGYHAMAGTEAGIMEHTITGGIHRLTINGEPAGEIALSVAAAGVHGVPVVAVSSDANGCAEVSALIPHVKTAVVKHGLGRYMGRLLHPSTTGKLIEEAAKSGVSGLKSAKTWLPAQPVSIGIEFNRSEEADYCAKLLGAARSGAYGVSVTYPTFPEAHQALWDLVGLSFAGQTAGN